MGYILLEELNFENLKSRSDEVIERLKNEIAQLRAGKEKEVSDEGTKKLKVLTDDYQQLVQKSRTMMMTNKYPSNIRVIANKIDKIWRENIYPLICLYDMVVDNYNQNHKNKLQHICKRTGDEVLPSIKTFKHFNY